MERYNLYRLGGRRGRGRKSGNERRGKSIFCEKSCHEFEVIRKYGSQMTMITVLTTLIMNPYEFCICRRVAVMAVRVTKESCHDNDNGVDNPYYESLLRVLYLSSCCCNGRQGD